MKIELKGGTIVMRRKHCITNSKVTCDDINKNIQVDLQYYTKIKWICVLKFSFTFSYLTGNENITRDNFKLRTMTRKYNSNDVLVSISLKLPAEFLLGNDWFKMNPRQPFPLFLKVPSFCYYTCRNRCSQVIKGSLIGYVPDQSTVYI